MVEKRFGSNHLGVVPAPIAFLVACPKLYAPEPTGDAAPTYVPRLERILKQNIVPFWYDKSLNRVNGGYVINFGPTGELKAPGVGRI